MTAQPWWADGVDLTRPSSARVYDVHLGGSHNFQVDRDVAEEAARLMPTLPEVLRANRSFLRRAVRYLVQHGVTQFLDLGSGIPTVGNVHEIAQRENPDCRIVYVDRDLVAVTHSRALLHANPSAAALHADFRDAEDVLGRPEARSLLDFTQPVAVLLLAVLHFVSDDDNPAGVVAAYRDRIVPGSYVAISHAAEDNTRESSQAASTYSRRLGGFWLRSQEYVTRLFSGLSLTEPGVVPLNAWRPDDAVQADLPGYAGVAVKP